MRNSLHVASTPGGDIGIRATSVALLGRDGRTRWEQPYDGPASVAASLTHVAVATVATDRTSELRALDVRDGSVVGSARWPGEILGTLHEIDGAFVMVGPTVAVIDVDVTGQPTVRWSTDALVDAEASAFTLGGELVLLGRSRIVRLDLADGTPVSAARLPALTAPYAAVRGDTAYATAGREVVALRLDREEPTVRWRASVASRITSAPTLAGDRLYVGTETGTIEVLTLDGDPVASLDTSYDEPVVGAPTVANGLVYAFADRGRHLVAIGTP